MDILLYWGLEDHYGSRALNIALAGGGWWLINMLLHSKRYGFGVINAPDDYGIATMFTMLVISLVATYVGAKLFDKLERE